jgi:REP element-mobilizing transposase RayT
VDRHWFLTSTFYGNWLPGDSRGFVSRVRDRRPGDPETQSRREHDAPGTPCDADLPGLHHSARDLLKGPPICIDCDQAKALLAQFHETATHRGWRLLAVAVMYNHAHLVVGVPGDPDPTRVLGDFKAYGSRTLNRQWGKPPSGTWWTYDGSKRKLSGGAAIRGVVRYLVEDQPDPLVVYYHSASYP